jgi:hypothetical protein
MIAKPGKNPADVTSYRPISLLPLLSKILENILLRWLTPILADAKSVPCHQFGFRPQHGTVEQAHRIVHKINYDLDNKSLCTAAFIDISQAFDKFGTRDYFTNLNRPSLTRRTPSWRPVSRTEYFRCDTKRNTPRFTPYIPGYHKVASSAPSSIHSIQRTYRKLNRHSLRPTLMIWRFWPLTMIQSLPLNNFNIICVGLNSV